MFWVIVRVLWVIYNVLGDFEGVLCNFFYVLGDFEGVLSGCYVVSK